MLGGRVPQDLTGESLSYGGQLLERVQEFKYLGLIFTPAAALSSMRTARLVAAKKAWGVL